MFDSVRQYIFKSFYTNSDEYDGLMANDDAYRVKWWSEMRHTCTELCAARLQKDIDKGMGMRKAGNLHRSRLRSFFRRLAIAGFAPPEPEEGRPPAQPNPVSTRPK